ncbi:MocR-like pyridoxine biosynthesis transcription factor PdxR [Spelaeicoccus albus]|uniref:GntR family transcriptional regulator/MocR family aminotransferase n=1 Tax=Spelaeicoccus albus TaxID=1280376 RepID=A0A7Z0AA97_9MICO|nr:PLP-dependent aminotransferase family protein [Spelaeicoccus albus]NYI66481.1 GntR family transcriptional regulator/MocR family aminotransferase [Spelaeicoccus albus]
MPRLTPGTERPFVVDRHSATPLPVQIAEQFRRAVRDSSLQPGDRVPATRALAGQLGVSRGTVVSAYDQLTAEGYLIGSRGTATVINPQLARVHPDDAQAGAVHPGDAPPPDDAHPDGGPAPAERSLRRSAAGAKTWAPDAVIDLRPGRTDTRRLADSGWRAAWRQATSSTPRSATVPPAGIAELREAIAEHLRLMRGLVADPATIVITAGAREGMALLLLTLAARGPGIVTHRRNAPSLRVAVEDPGYPTLRQVLVRLGADVVPVPVDADGLVVTELARHGTPPDAVIVTPSHQYPLGGSMPVARRTALLEWARECGALVVEDDYDSEFRYVSAPLPALASLAHVNVGDNQGTVVTLGTFSKLLTPWLGAGYLIAPPELARELIDMREALGAPVSGIVQQALAGYLTSGGLRRHAARMRRDYKRRRELLASLLDGVPDVGMQPIDGGLHAVLQLPPDADVGHRVRQAAERGVLVGDLADYWSDRAASQPGIVIGYGGVSDDELRAGLRTLLGVL